MNPFLKPELQRNLVLASASLRRSEILERLGFEFEVLPADIEENDASCADHALFAIRLAVKKAEEIGRARPLATVIAADTIVVCGDARLGKPADEADASSMLRSLSGRAHEVITGVAVIAPDGRRLAEAERTRVYFRVLSEEDVARYVGTGEPFGKAGAYAIQGYAAPFIQKIDGCYFNVVGLPVSLLFTMLLNLERTGDDPADR